jgi:hypothetical protein
MPCSGNVQISPWVLFTHVYMCTHVIPQIWHVKEALSSILTGSIGSPGLRAPIWMGEILCFYCQKWWGPCKNGGQSEQCSVTWGLTVGQQITRPQVTRWVYSCPLSFYRAASSTQRPILKKQCQAEHHEETWNSWFMSKTCMGCQGWKLESQLCMLSLGHPSIRSQSGWQALSGSGQGRNWVNTDSMTMEEPKGAESWIPGLRGWRVWKKWQQMRADRGQGPESQVTRKSLDGCVQFPVPMFLPSPQDKERMCVLRTQPGPKCSPQTLLTVQDSPWWALTLDLRRDSQLDSPFPNLPKIILCCWYQWTPSLEWDIKLATAMSQVTTAVLPPNRQEQGGKDPSVPLSISPVELLTSAALTGTASNTSSWNQGGQPWRSLGHLLEHPNRHMVGEGCVEQLRVKEHKERRSRSWPSDRRALTLELQGNRPYTRTRGGNDALEAAWNVFSLATL